MRESDTAHIIHVPVDDVEREPVSGHPVVRLAGELQRVAWHADLGCWLIVTGDAGARDLGMPVWRAAPGLWRSGHVADFMGAVPLPSQTVAFNLPPIPRLPVDPEPVPALIHYIWIGNHGMPGELMAGIAANVAKSPGFATIVHGHADSRRGRELLRAQVASTGGHYNNLDDDRGFGDFMASPLGVFYRRFLPASQRNFGAASDILRAFLLHERGGVYLDCDDRIEAAWPDPGQLVAGRADLLLNKMVRVPHLGFRGYNSSNFACHAGNPVLAALLEEMHVRLAAAATFVASARPWRETVQPDDADSVQQMEVYKLRILHLTGPVVLNDVLCGLRPDYYSIEARLLHAYRQLNPQPAEPCVVADSYFDRMHAVKRHYLPFAEGPFAVTVGNADSWNRRAIARP